MSTNKHGETELCEVYRNGSVFCITRDLAGNHILRSGGYNGKELFSKTKDDGRKNTKTGRIKSVLKLYDLIDQIAGD